MTRTRQTYAWPIPRRDAWPEDPTRHHVIVVGAGIGGLSAGALLATRGFKVLVVEAHDRPGGYCSSWNRRVRRNGETLTYRFDAGVQDISGLGTRGPLRHLLRNCGRNTGSTGGVSFIATPTMD